MKRGSVRWNVLIFVAILILVLVLLYSGLQILESTVLREDTGVVQDIEKKTIYRDGVAYYPRLDTTVVMLTGVDTEGPMVSSGSYNNPAEADMVALLIFDETNERVDILTLNRDSMVQMDTLGVGGKPAGKRFGQLALAHTYGSGLKDSSRNLQNTVSDLLYGIDIDHYVTINMDAIAIANDAVGGVTVEVTEDFSQVDPTIPMGTVTLMGDQAKNYVRLRYDVDDQMNVSRMERQKKYMDGFFDAMEAKGEEDPYFLLSVYDQLADYMVTECSTATLTNLIDDFRDYEMGEFISIDGDNIKGEKYMEYHLDEKDLERVIFQYFYAPKK